MKQKLLIFFLFGLFALNNAFAQNRKITGVVTGADDGLPLPGVSVMVQGTKIGTLTDGDGRYNLNMPATGSVISFTFIGYTTQNLTITGSNTYNVKLATSTRQLTEVVVTDGYSVQSKKSYTGAASTVRGAENENKPFSTVQQALQGEVPGLNVTVNSGQPGANVQIRIRGVNSVSLDSNPLYVIDGMIVNSGQLSRAGASNTNTGTSNSNALSGLNEDDIESITVLKDASATAIYGSRGSNGVIVITTKRGKAGKTQVRFDTEVGNTSNLAIPEAGKPVTGDQYRTLFIEGYNNASAAYLANTANDPTKNPYTPTAIASATDNYGLNGPSNNWYNLVTKRGSQQQYNVSMSGGSEDTRVFASAGYFKQQATEIASDLTRVTGLLNIDHKISKRITSTTGLNFSNVNQNTPYNSGYFANPIAGAYFLRPFQLGYNTNGSVNSTIGGNTNFPGFYNPLWLASHDKKNLLQSKILGNESIKWNIWDQLNFTSYASIDYNVLEEKYYQNSIMGDARTVGGSGTDNYTRYFNWLLRNQLDYRYNVKGVEDFYVDATIGYEAQRSQEYYSTIYATGYPGTQPTLTAVANASTPVTASSSFSNYTFDSFYSRANINFKNRYSVSGSFRRDGSSRFGSNNEFGNFYSVGGAWNIDQEQFFKIQKVLSTAKIRSSFGTTGNAGNAGNGQAQITASGALITNINYLWRPLASYGYNYVNGTGQQYNVVGNPNLTWETTHKFDIGTDFGFFNDRLAFSLDYYHNNIDRLISSIQVSRTTGFSSVYGNIGSLINKGAELAIKGIPVKTKDFTWTTNFNISLNQNRISKLANAAGQNGNYYLAPGYDYYTYYVKVSAGVDPANGNALWYTDNTKTTTTTNYSSAAYQTYKQADPKVFGGFNNTFNYKGIVLAADFYYNYGNYIYDSYSQYLNAGAYYNYGKYQYVYENRWTTPGQVTDVPKYTVGGIPANNGNDGSFSSRYFYKGDYIRLKNLSIGYDFKNITYLKSIGIGRLYLYGRGTNVFTKTYDKRLPFDPETSIGGSSNIETPQARTFTIGLNVGF